MTTGSLADRITAFDTGAHVTGIVWLKDVAAYALGDGQIVLDRNDVRQTLAAHPDSAILTLALRQDSLLTGGEDGRVVETRADGSSIVLAETTGWIDALASGPKGAFAYASGRRAFARNDRGQDKIFDAPSTVRGLAFAPKGYRLALSHYNGASLWYPDSDAAPERLSWKGSHLDVSFSPDNRFLVTSLQENALHGWQLQGERVDMRMTGYPGKSRSLSWSCDGDWLASSGAEAVIIWPFSKDGPMGKAPRECGVAANQVTCVAFHPKALVLAAGYEDGSVLMIRLGDASEIMIRKPQDGGAITGLAWDSSGGRLAFGTTEGIAGFLSLFSP